MYSGESSGASDCMPVGQCDSRQGRLIWIRISNHFLAQRFPRRSRCWFPSLRNKPLSFLDSCHFLVEKVCVSLCECDSLLYRPPAGLWSKFTPWVWLNWKVPTHYISLSHSFGAFSIGRHGGERRWLFLSAKKLYTTFTFQRKRGWNMGTGKGVLPALLIIFLNYNFWNWSWVNLPYIRKC
jgi:hypothetical protein